MTSHDTANDFYGLVHESELEKFKIDEDLLIPNLQDQLASDLIIDFFRTRMHGDAYVTHMPGMQDTSPLMLSEHSTRTSDVFSIRYKFKTSKLSHFLEATSLIIPHDTRINRLAETHTFSYGQGRLNEGSSVPLSTGHYRLLRYMGHVAQSSQALRIAS